MTALAVFVLWFLLDGASGASNLKFPPGFKFGAATSAYQIEGSWNISDKSQSTWDTFSHTRPHDIADGSNGDVACDSYHRWQDDIDIATQLGLHFYRFSISWPRILPTGFTNYISEEGCRYYNNLIDGLLDKGIEPMVTIYHWDLPQRLQNLGGWSNPLIADWFADYAKVLFTVFGDRVKDWITLNEPLLMCFISHTAESFAPPFQDYDVANFLCTKNVMMAHAKAWRIYDQEFRKQFQGRVGMTQQIIHIDPMSKDEEDLAMLSMELYNGLYIHPIFSKDGGWPPNIEKVLEENSKKKGFAKSRLPAFTDEERDLVKGSYDFLGFNYYTGRMVRNVRDGEKTDLFMPLDSIPEIDAILESDPKWTRSPITTFHSYPEGIRKQLSALKKLYGDIEIYITENGYACEGFNLQDYIRVHFIRDHLEQVLLAIHEDKVKVTRYTVWSLMDNYEWSSGYSVKFGLYEVDFDDPKRSRTPRYSAEYYAHVIKNNTIDIPKKYMHDEL